MIEMLKRLGWFVGLFKYAALRLINHSQPAVMKGAWRDRTTGNFLQRIQRRLGEGDV